MNAPNGRHAGDVAEIRDSLVSGLQGKVGRALEDWNVLAIEMGKPAPTSVAVELSGLEEAKLFWVPPDETQVIADAATDLPEGLTLSMDMLPSASGFVVFGGNFYGIDSSTGGKSIWPMRAFRWGPINIPRYCGPDGLGLPDSEWMAGVAISAYSFTLDMRDSALKNFNADEIAERVTLVQAVADEVLGSKFAFIPKTRHFWEQGGMNDLQASWMPLGRSDWGIGEDWRHHAVYNESDTAYASVIEDRCLMTALWSLMAACAPIDHTPNRAERRRAERSGRALPPTRIVTWRGPQGQRVAVGPENESRHQTVRYRVKRHWRFQAYGPGRTLRKWILIPPHWRGPDDAPLADPHETIHKIVGTK